MELFNDQDLISELDKFLKKTDSENKTWIARHDIMLQKEVFLKFLSDFIEQQQEEGNRFVVEEAQILYFDLHNLNKMCKKLNHKGA